MKRRNKLAYRNATPEAVELRDRLTRRTTEVVAARDAFADGFAAAAGHPEIGRVGLLVGSSSVMGVEWPNGTEPPAGWRRSREEPRCIVPALRTKAGKQIEQELRKLSWPGYRQGLRKLGINDPVTVDWGHTNARGESGWWCFAAVCTEEPGALWIAYTTRDVEDAPDMQGIEAHGWERRPIEEYEAGAVVSAARVAAAAAAEVSDV